MHDCFLSGRAQKVKDASSAVYYLSFALEVEFASEDFKINI
jgi:hypothetical protein